MQNIPNFIISFRHAHKKKVSSCIALEVVKTLKICHCALLFEYLYTVYVFNCNKNVENEGLKGKLE